MVMRRWSAERTWSLSSVVFLFAGTLVLGILANVFLSIGPSAQSYADNRATARLIEDYEKVLSIASHLSREKIPATMLIASGADSDLTLSGALHGQRYWTDRAIEDVRQNVCRDDTCRAWLADLRMAISSMRQATDLLVAADREVRRGTEIHAAFDTGHHAFDMIRSMINEIKQQLVFGGADLSGFAVTAHLAVELQELGSDALSYAIAPVVDQRPLSSTEREEMFAVLSRFNGLAALLPSSADIRDYPSYAEALRGVETIMMERSLPFFRSIADGNRYGATWGTFLAWVNASYIPSLSTIDSLGTTLITTMTDRAHENRKAALKKLVISGIVGLVTSLGVWLIAINARRSLTRPFHEASRIANSLARDRDADFSGSSPRITEFTRLFDALATLDIRLLERRQMMEKLRLQAETDGLTGLMSREYFETRATSEITRHTRDDCGMIVLDLDSFKAVNDTMGHQFGDKLLAEIGAVLRPLLEGTTIICRIGGDEFAVFSWDSTPVERLALARTIFQKITSITEMEGTPISVGISVGLSCGAGGKDRFDALYREADTALYISKRAGRNRITMYTPDGVGKCRTFASPDPPQSTCLTGDRVSQPDPILISVHQTQ